MNIGLTGGMGCGKSTVLKLFASGGANVMDSDQVVRRLLSEDEGVKEELRERFGKAIFDEEGNIDRGTLGRMVFGDSEKLTFLESVLHPRVRAIWTQACAQNQSLLVVEIPLLFEKELESYFDRTLCVSCTAEKQKERLQQRGYDEEQINQRLNKQMPLREKMERADTILFNNGTLGHLEAQVELLLTDYHNNNDLAP